MLEFNDIQSGVLRPRPTPYAATYIILRIDDRAAGHELLKRLIPKIASATDLTSPAGDAWVAVALSYHGLKALGVPQASLASFSPEFQQGMAARAAELGDVGESDPENWERPWGTSEVHLVLATLAPDSTRLAKVLEPARQAYQQMSGVTAIYRQDCYQLPTGREPFGFRDGIGQPAIEGSGLAGSNPQEAPLKAGEFILGYLDESGRLPPQPQPEVLGRNGSYVALRKLHQDVAAFRRYLAAHTTSAAEEEWVAAKMMGRWRSGAPLALCPEHDDLELGADPKRNNDFLYYDDDPKGLKCPLGSHARRMNPRDQFKHEITQVNRHRLIRRGTVYGPLLPEGSWRMTEPTAASSSSSSVLHFRGSSSLSRVSGSIRASSSGHLVRRIRLLAQRWDGRVHHPQAAHPPTPPRLAAVRDQPRRGILLYAQPAGFTVAGGRRVCCRVRRGAER